MTTSSGIEVAEYASLRSEILKLIELQAQIVTVLLVAFGAVSSIAFQSQNGDIAFIYPFLAAFLAITWTNHAHAVERCAAYVRIIEAQQFDPVYPGQNRGWERYVEKRPIRFGNLGSWGARLIFPGTASVSVAIGFGLGPPTGGTRVLAIIGSVVSLALILVLLFWRERHTAS